MKRFPIKILFNVWADTNNTNAQSLNARDIALRLNPERFESSMFLAREPDKRLLSHKGIHLIHLPARFGSVVMVSHLIWGRYDILFYSPYIKCAEWYRFLRTMGKRKKLILPVEGPLQSSRDENPKAFLTFRRILAQSHVIVPISESLREFVEESTGFKASICIPVGVDTRFFTPCDRNGSKNIRVLFVGRLIQRKGPDLVLEAARIFQNVEFSLVGTTYGREDGLFASELKRRTSEEGLANVRFLGKLSQGQVRDLMHRSDILLLPSRIEGIPKVTLEAAATGLPCIVFDGYHTPSVVNGVTGFQVKTFQEMLRRLGDLIKNREQRLGMGIAGTQHAKKFDWEIIVKQWERVFEETVGKRARVV